MRSRSSAQFLLVSLFVVGLVSAWWYPQLPDMLASHFNGAGVADGWMTKDMFFLVMALAGVGSGLSVAGGGLVVRWVDPSKISIPHPEYWLAPERRVQALDRLEGMLYECGAVTLFGVAGCLHLVAWTNMMAEPVLPNGPFLAGLFGYLAYTAVWLFLLLWGFRKPAGP
jgi:hypothetical protein